MVPVAWQCIMRSGSASPPALLLFSRTIFSYSRTLACPYKFCSFSRKIPGFCSCHGPDYLSHHLQLLRVCVSRKLESEAKLRFEHRPGLPIGEAGIPKSLLTTVPNICLHLILLRQSFFLAEKTGLTTCLLVVTRSLRSSLCSSLFLL